MATIPLERLSAKQDLKPAYIGCKPAFIDRVHAMRQERKYKEQQRKWEELDAVRSKERKDMAEFQAKVREKLEQMAADRFERQAQETKRKAQAWCVIGFALVLVTLIAVV